MLVLKVKPGESFVVGDATIHIERKNRICIDAPQNVKVVRSSVLERDKKNGEEKARNSEESTTESKGPNPKALHPEEKRFLNC